MTCAKKQISTSADPVLRPTKIFHRVRQGLCVFGAVALLGQLLLAYHYFSTNLQPRDFSRQAANSTLGFGAIYAVSRKDSPRRQSLLSAASLTNLDITIPAQPVWTTTHIDKIKALENSSLNRGSALAWLGHRNVLETFLRSTDDTALIMEDDVDWDVRLRQDQIPQTAYAIKELLGSQHGGYYGNTNNWDIIWLGHCGDYFNASRGSNLSVIKSYHDPAMPDLAKLHPWTREFMRGIGANQNKQRLVHESVSPLCTFAYAITRAAAERVLNEIAVSEPIRDPSRPCRAYDVRLLEGCRDEGLRCITVNPELFHHSAANSEIAQVSDEINAKETEPTEGQIEEPTESPANNIRCSARSRKWKEIQDRIADPSVNAELFVRELAEFSPHCYIDDL